MKRTVTILCAALLVILLCACGAGAPSAPAEVTPVPTPEPTPTPPPTELTLTDESAEEILALAEIPSLRYIDATGSREYDALLQLRQALPDCEIHWVYDFQGVSYPSDTKSLTVTDMTGLEDALRCLPELEEVDLLEAGAELADLDRFSAIRPDVFYLWEFFFRGFTIRTDIPVYSTLQDLYFVREPDENFYPLLKYCKKLKALDLGHNDLRDLTLIGQLTDLQVLILADNPNIIDASPLGNLHELIYLELFMCPNIEDFSFLNELTKIRDLNLCYDETCTNLDFLGYMPDFTFGLFKYTGVPVDHYNSWKERLPDARMTLWDGNLESCESGWRETRRNHMIRQAFANWPSIVDYRSYDDLDFEFYGQIYNITHFA